MKGPEREGETRTRRGRRLEPRRRFQEQRMRDLKPSDLEQRGDRQSPPWSRTLLLPDISYSTRLGSQTDFGREDRPR